MRLDKIYQFAVKRGMELDPRGKQEVKNELEKAKKDFEAMKPDEKDGFDKEGLWNPYSDTRILYGERKRQIRRILVGIDMEIGEVLLAERLREKGNKIDLILSHHPEGYALAGFYEVMHMQADILSKYGVPINVAEGLLEKRIKEVERKVLPLNHARAVDAARMLDIAFLCVHTPADNHVASFLQSKFDKGNHSTVGDIIKFLKTIPEYKEGFKNKAGPKVIAGSEKNRAGKILAEMTGGTEGAKELLEKMSQAGIGTIVGMHMGEENLKEAEKHHINVVIAGHMASDTLGMNLLIDHLVREERLEITPCSGFRRMERGATKRRRKR